LEGGEIDVSRTGVSYRSADALFGLAGVGLDLRVAYLRATEVVSRSQRWSGPHRPRSYPNRPPPEDVEHRRAAARSRRHLPRDEALRRAERYRRKNMYEQKNRVGKAAVLVAGLALALSGCGTDTAPEAEGPSEEGIVTAVDAPLRAPAWAEDEGVVIALQEDGRQLVRLDTAASFDGTGSLPVTISEELDGVAGENLALEKGREPDGVYLPKPERDQVAVVENDDLLEVRTFPAGESPVRVALGGATTGGSASTLFALSRDGSTVTSVGLEDFEVLAEVEVGASEDALIEASGEDGFWLAGSGGVALYSVNPPELRGELSVAAGALAVDAVDPERAYVAESSSGRVMLVEPGGEGELRVVAETDLGTPGEYLAVKDGGLYAVTRDELVALDSGSLEIVETVELGPIFEGEDLEQAEPSGLAVGEENVYVTLAGEPYVLLIEKP